MLDTLERPKTLKEQALEKLREAITLGIFKPGERLVERSLCSDLGISRSVVRECIRHLESERLIAAAPNSGPSVAILDADEVREIYEIRALLEMTAVRSCAKHASDKTVQQLRRYCDDIAHALQHNDILEALKFTTLFYETIFLSGGKSVSWDLAARLNGRISRLRAITLSSEGRATKGPENLREIIKQIECRQPEAAAHACQKHIAEASEIALQALDTLKT